MPESKPAPSVRVLGVDPGLTATGYGVIEMRAGRGVVVETGTIRPGRGDLGARLSKIFLRVREVIERCAPGAAAFEDIFHHKNVRSVLMLGQARGAAIVAAAETGIPVFEYSALQVKQAVVGYGRAEKAQVQKMIPSLLVMDVAPDSADAFDALAVAWCHAGHAGSPGRPWALPAGMRRGRR